MAVCSVALAAESLAMMLIVVSTFGVSPVITVLQKLTTPSFDTLLTGPATAVASVAPSFSVMLRAASVWTVPLMMTESLLTVVGTANRVRLGGVISGVGWVVRLMP